MFKKMKGSILFNFDLYSVFKSNYKYTEIKAPHNPLAGQLITAWPNTMAMKLSGIKIILT